MSIARHHPHESIGFSASSIQPFEFQDVKSWAELGDAESQYELAMMYGSGDAIPRDYIQAHVWSAVAAANGADDGRIAQSEFAAHMTPDQIDQAQKLAREYLEKYHSN